MDIIDEVTEKGVVERRFDLKVDDEVVPSKDKAMHIHPGGHVGIPLYERDAYEAFYRRHLGVPA